MKVNLFGLDRGCGANWHFACRHTHFHCHCLSHQLTCNSRQALLLVIQYM